MTAHEEEAHFMFTQDDGTAAAGLALFHLALAAAEHHGFISQLAFVFSAMLPATIGVVFGIIRKWSIAPTIAVIGASAALAIASAKHASPTMMFALPGITTYAIFLAKSDRLIATLVSLAGPGLVILSWIVGHTFPPSQLASVALALWATAAAAAVVSQSRGHAVTALVIAVGAAIHAPAAAFLPGPPGPVLAVVAAMIGLQGAVLGRTPGGLEAAPVVLYCIALTVAMIAAFVGLSDSTLIIALGALPVAAHLLSRRRDSVVLKVMGIVFLIPVVALLLGRHPISGRLALGVIDWTFASVVVAAQLGLLAKLHPKLQTIFGLAAGVLCLSAVSTPLVYAFGWSWPISAVWGGTAIVVAYASDTPHVKLAAKVLAAGSLVKLCSFDWASMHGYARVAILFVGAGVLLIRALTHTRSTEGEHVEVGFGGEGGTQPKGAAASSWPLP